MVQQHWPTQLHRNSRFRIGAAIALLTATMGIVGTASAIAQVTEPEDTEPEVDVPALDPEAPEPELERQVVNCMATATLDTIEWGHRYTYWLSGIAKFDDAGNMLPVSNDHAGDWILTITNSLLPNLETHNVYPLRDNQEPPIFLFPAVTYPEWTALDGDRSGEYVTAFSYDDATHGLFMGIRNTTNEDSPRQIFQVVHFISEDTAMVSEVSSCFVGPRPMVIGSDEPFGADQQAIAF